MTPEETKQAITALRTSVADGNRPNAPQVTQVCDELERLMEPKPAGPPFYLITLREAKLRPGGTLITTSTVSGHYLGSQVGWERYKEIFKHAAIELGMDADVTVPELYHIEEGH